ncbi:MAG: YbaB/EbfC family nucleoid-associated protein [Lachnospiraceae bacterium]|jgi:DNA-binding YbaB/EbfC family protein|nr:YbaB/EbfC family nucleoid-associated protein [Lachnospiraceae bacterium]MBR4165224.1 YbaB/EbfC family nucleoid-associated protein [Lachnospiraceae bacterium]
MAKYGGGYGNMNMTQLMKQAQRMQRKMEEQQAEFEKKEFEASAGGGAVTVKMNGKKELLSVTLSPDVVDPEDIEMLQDLIVAAFNECVQKINEENAQNMDSMTGGLGGFGGMF